MKFWRAVVTNERTGKVHQRCSNNRAGLEAWMGWLVWQDERAQPHEYHCRLRRWHAPKQHKRLRTAAAAKRRET